MSMQRSVVVIPGGRYGPYVPQLFFPMMAAIQRGAQPRAVEWEDPETISELVGCEVPSFVERHADPFLAMATPGQSVVVAKSLGSYAAARVAQLGLPAIWITPILNDDFVVSALQKATAPFLLIGGTDDQFWDSLTARSLSEHVLEVRDANHGLFAPGPLALSAQNMAQLAEASEKFLDTVVWPAI